MGIIEDPNAPLSDEEESSYSDLDSEPQSRSSSSAGHGKYAPVETTGGVRLKTHYQWLENSFFFPDILFVAVP